jgi:hypothetical protein
MCQARCRAGHSLDGTPSEPLLRGHRQDVDEQTRAKTAINELLRD